MYTICSFTFKPENVTSIQYAVLLLNRKTLTSIQYGVLLLNRKMWQFTLYCSVKSIYLRSVEDRLCDIVVRDSFPALPDFLRSSGSGTGSTQPREYNWRNSIGYDL
jgi:hypothetical protein